jgi:hypothetical protein
VFVVRSSGMVGLGWVDFGLFFLYEMATLVDGNRSPFIYGLVNVLAEIVCPLAGCRIE